MVLLHTYLIIRSKPGGSADGRSRKHVRGMLLTRRRFARKRGEGIARDTHIFANIFSLVRQDRKVKRANRTATSIFASNSFSRVQFNDFVFHLT